jgi:hypothetical protein
MGEFFFNFINNLSLMMIYKKIIEMLNFSFRILCIFFLQIFLLKFDVLFCMQTHNYNKVAVSILFFFLILADILQIPK